MTEAIISVPPVINTSDDSFYDLESSVTDQPLSTRMLAIIYTQAKENKCLKNENCILHHKIIVGLNAVFKETKK